ncbi:protoporphyrinogen oxidase [Brachionus plicatilis]|uniref:Protoporphyrinogen oxidase n=1 Tax=Brachionus plicatilis TaxID=10195 RepID=A0A3M7STL4_BRAPC|nr:protoporphyrinogen oxidase [Brachionus plicatilis]
MKIAVIGGGISGLSAAYYLKKFSLPISEIVLYEASNRFGGWIDSKKASINQETVFLEKGPRTLRLATGELKEINSIKLAKDLNLSSDIEIISKNHPASVNRYIYFNGRINAIKPKLIGKTPLMSKGLLRYLFKELRSPKRDSSVQDETIWSFISRRLDPDIAENLIDPVFKGITGGDIRNLSAAALLKTFYEYENNFGSISKGAFDKAKNPKSESYEKYQDLLELRDEYKHQSVWRFKDGMHKLTERLADELSKYDNVKLCLNDPVQSLNVKKETKEKSMTITSKNSQQDFDLVISSVYSKLNNQFLPDEFASLKENLAKIDAVDMVVINFLFKENVLPLKGFGYLVPSSQKSPILGCIFDSVFNRPQEKNTCLTVMMGGAWFDEYLKNKSSDEILSLALSEIRKHLDLKVEPDYQEISILKEAIPQYRVGHLQLLDQIKCQLKEYDLNERLYLTGFSYDGIGINDCIFNARKLVQDELINNSIIKNLLK